MLTERIVPASQPLAYRVRLFGGLEATGETGTTITRFRTRKTALLLAYLALHRNRKHAREELIELFWPDLAPGAARDNLSGCLSSLRRCFGGTDTPAVLADRDTVWLNTPVVDVDVVAFESLLDRAERPTSPAEQCTILESAVALYRGPLLTGVYEEWALSEQTRLAERFTLALAALADAQSATGATDRALATARRAQQTDPFNESPYQTQMRVLATLGKVEAAHTIYRDFEAYMQRQLGCRPSPALQRFRQPCSGFASPWSRSPHRRQELSPQFLSPSLERCH